MKIRVLLKLWKWTSRLADRFLRGAVESGPRENWRKIERRGLGGSGESGGQ